MLLTIMWNGSDKSGIGRRRIPYAVTGFTSYHTYDDNISLPYRLVSAAACFSHAARSEICM